jgi:uncharacterized protein
MKSYFSSPYRFVSIFLVIAGIGFFLYFSPDSELNTEECLKIEHETANLLINSTSIEVDISDNINKRRCGLSHRTSLGNKNGMLFVFDVPAKYGIWMKGMKFSIDIIWLDSEWRVVEIAHNIDPDTYPTVFKPEKDSLYVLETPSGMADQYGISSGSIFTQYEPST